MSSGTGVSAVADVLRLGGPSSKMGPVLVGFNHAVAVDPEAFPTFSVSSFSGEFVRPPQAAAGSQTAAAAAAGEKLKLDVKLTTPHLTYSTSAPSVKGCKRQDHQFRTTFLALRNKVTGKVRLVETTRIMLGPEITFPPSSNGVLMQEEMKKMVEGAEQDAAVKQQNRAFMNRHLVREFGQAKGKRIYEQSDRMTVEAESLNEKLGKAAMSVDQASLRDASQDAPPDLGAGGQIGTDQVLLPPCNRHATTVSGVYSLNSILSEEELQILEDSATEFSLQYDGDEQIRKGIGAKSFSAMFGDAMIKFSSDVPGKGARQLAIALYIEGLVSFFNLRAQEFSKGPKGLIPNMLPAFIRQKIFRSFTNPDGGVTPETRDKVVCHVIVLGLLLYNFSFEFNHLASSFHVKADHLKRLVRVTGASVQSDDLTKKSFVILRLPLVTFDASMPLKRRKKATRNR